MAWGEHFLKVSQPLRQSLKSYNPKFGMDKCVPRDGLIMYAVRIVR